MAEEKSAGIFLSKITNALGPPVEAPIAIKDESLLLVLVLVFTGFDFVLRISAFLGEINLPIIQIDNQTVVIDTKVLDILGDIL